MYDVAEKIFALYYQDGSYIEHDDYQAEITENTMFSGGYAAMATMLIRHLESPDIRSMQQEYGVVPIPKYSESQTTYHSQMHNGFTLASIPSTISADRADMLSAVLEAMSSISYRIVRPVYYETVLRTQLAKDPQSAAMIDLIMDNIHIDIAFSYSTVIGNFHQALQQTVDSGRIDGLISNFEKQARSSKRSLMQLIDKLDKLAENS